MADLSVAGSAPATVVKAYQILSKILAAPSLGHAASSSGTSGMPQGGGSPRSVGPSPHEARLPEWTTIAFSAGS